MWGKRKYFLKKAEKAINVETDLGFEVRMLLKRLFKRGCEGADWVYLAQEGSAGCLRVIFP
jgi:hypothetical protein